LHHADPEVVDERSGITCPIQPRRQVVDQADKLVLVQHLPLSPVDRTLCRLSI